MNKEKLVAYVMGVGGTCSAWFVLHHIGKLAMKVTGMNSNKINTKQKLCQYRHFIPVKGKQ